MRWNTALALGVIISVLGQSASAATWEGKWASSPEVCIVKRDSSGIYLEDPSPIELNRNKFEGLEFLCEVLAIDAIQDEIGLALKCAEEGTEYDDHLLVKVVEGKLRFRRIGGESMSLFRCE